ncbi:hypothetical protein BY458DRAFT_507734 [Sporodiniella umbellata]|nr:hypothetical protein BY458DRAFT_507734 [Sporodiniella umbellata]
MSGVEIKNTRFLSNQEEKGTVEKKGTELYFEEKVKAMFELTLDEKLLNRYSCYIIGIVTLPGWLYITTRSVCFHALLPETKKGPRKSGYLTKKKRMSSPRSFRYYFELSGHVLSWYESIESRYLPLKSIDLVHVILIEPHKSKRNKFGIRLQTDSDRFILIADSEISQKEWLDELQKSVFLAQHAGNQMRIVLKHEKIVSIEKPMIFQFAENVKVKALEDEGTKDRTHTQRVLTCSKYYFAFFLDINEAYHCIADTWKRASGIQEKSATVSPSQSHDSFFNNVSLTTFPTIFMHRLMTTQNKEEDEEDEDEDEEDEEFSEKDDRSNTKTRTSRSGSLNTLKHFITPTYLYNKLSSPQDANTSTISIQSKTRRRSSSIGSSLFSLGSKSWGFLSEREHIDEIWISQSMAKSITPNIMNKPLDIWEKEQESSNRALNNLFPMLLGLENAEAVFKCSVWKTIPHHGRIYMTEKHLCFYSKTAVGKQRLLIPWADVTDIEAIQTKTYLVSCAISMSVKDIKELLQFDFPSAQLRDQCFYICQLKTRDIADTSSVLSKGSLQRKEIDLNGPLPVELPKKYNGPPLLTCSPKVTEHLKKAPEQPLHITCLTIGSRGDVQPYIALCKELKKDGHTCRIATHAEYQEWVESHDIEFRCIGGDPGELMKLCIENSFLSMSFIREGVKFVSSI